MVYQFDPITGAQVEESGTLLFTTRKARVLATTIAALDERPEPAGTEPVTSKSAGTGISVDFGK